MRQSNSSPPQWSIVAAGKFVRATRDSGYSSTASAISELVDNSIQAGGTNIEVDIQRNNDGGISVDVCDNGCGMDLFTLRQALRFGGSSRFNDRTGLGRFGMGLPNSSLSQARRVIVTSWCNAHQSKRLRSNVVGRGAPLQTYLDLDEIASGSMIEVPKPRIVSDSFTRVSGRSGTIVQWKACDRLDYKRPSTIARHAKRELAQRFRYFLADGVRITVNDVTLQPVDPLFMLGRSPRDRSKPYGKEILYNIAADPDDHSAGVGRVRVRFAELPVAKLATLSNSEKRQRGIVNKAGASIVRGGREVDYGWFFFGTKRKENYDDWWRCEIQFDPILDEAFGLTHTKQQIRPKQYLIEILSPDLEHAARTLNSRARVAHGQLKPSIKPKKSEVIAKEKCKFLKPIQMRSGGATRTGISKYRIEVSPLEDGCFFSFRVQRGTFVLTLDSAHAFYRQIYEPLRDSDDTQATQLETLIELLLLSAARSEAYARPEDAHAIAEFRSNWSMAAETFIGG